MTIFGENYRPDAFAFLPEFQLRLLALLVRDRRWLAGHRSAVDYRYWEDPSQAILAELLLSHYDRYHVPPDELELAEALDSYLERRKDREPLRDHLADALQQVFGTDLGTVEHLSEKLLEFAKHQAVKAAVIRSASLLPEGDYSEIEELMRTALTLDVDRSKAGERYADLYARVARMDFADLRRPVPVGIGQLDAALGGGLGRTELGLIEGDTGLGKTLALIDFAAGACLAGYVVFYASLEDPISKLTERLNRRLTGWTRKEIEARKEETVTRIESILRFTRGEILLAWFPPDVTSWEVIPESIRAKEAEIGRTVDLVIVDYLNKVKPPRDGQKDHEAAKDLALRMVGYLGETEKAGWSAVQVTAEGGKAKTVTHQHAFGGRAQTHPARVILGLSQTEQEAGAKPWPKLRVNISKSTDSRARRAIPCYVDYERSRLVPYEEQKDEVAAGAPPVIGEKAKP